MKLQLFYAPNTCSMISYINLTEAGASFETHAMNFRKAENRTPEYLAINPMHKVPTLVVDGDRLTENVAIQLWIADIFPLARLMPSDKMDRLRAIELMSWFASEFHPHLSRVNSPAKYCSEPSGAASLVEIATQMLTRNFQIAEKRLAGREFFFEGFTAVDTYFFWCVRRARQLSIPIASFPLSASLFERVASRPSVQSYLSFEDAVKNQFADV